VAENGVFAGAGLASALLFFVPRRVWAAKLLGTGTILGQYAGQSWTRLSCPLPAEGLANFGPAGIVAFAAALGWACSRMSLVFDDPARPLRSLAKTAVPFASLFLFVVMRGELMSTLAVTAGYGFVYLCVNRALMYGVRA
jgi:hypothetical protein